MGSACTAQPRRVIQADHLHAHCLVVAPQVPMKAKLESSLSYFGFKHLIQIQALAARVSQGHSAPPHLVDLNLVKQDGLHQIAVVLHHGGLAGGERQRLGPAQAQGLTLVPFSAQLELFCPPCNPM